MERFFRYKFDHLLFWIVTIFFHIYTRFFLIAKVNFTQFLLEVVVRNVLLAIVIYTTLEILWPKLLHQKKYSAFVASVLAALLFYVAGKNSHDMYLYGHVLGDSSRTFFHSSFYNFSIALFYLAFSVALQLSKEWYFQRQLLQRIEIEKLNTELEYLKSQINPHFLFNSLNTVFFQIDKQNTEARETLSKFSDMLRYQLYECNGKEVSIEKELSYLKNYVDLQRVRSNENHRITFSTSDHLSGFTIAPLLLIPFVENAFKHVSHFADRPNEIAITVDKTGSNFKLSVMNSHEKMLSTKDRAGIGLRNVQRRLELLYPDRHVLTVKETGDLFVVELELKIA